MKPITAIILIASLAFNLYFVLERTALEDTNERLQDQLDWYKGIVDDVQNGEISGMQWQADDSSLCTDIAYYKRSCIEESRKKCLTWGEFI